MQEYLKGTSRSKGLKKVYIYILYIYVYKVVWYTAIMVKKKTKELKKASYMFTSKFPCTVSKTNKKSFPLKDDG